MTESGRRSAATGRGLSPTVVLALLLPLLTLGALFLAQSEAAEDPPRPPEPTTLGSASVICPSGATGTVFVGTGEESVQGDATALSDGEEQTVPLRSGQVSSVEDVPGPVVVTGTGDLAPGLLAARFGSRDLSAADCPGPRPEAWFTGVGAGASHNSVLELVNPDEGPAVADVTVYSPDGVLDVPQLRGVTVGGGDSVRLDLGSVVPRRTQLTLHLTVARGRLASSVQDEIPELGDRPQSLDWLPAQTEPATRSVLLGLAPGAGTDVLSVTNPGVDEARVTVKIMTADAVFAPEGVGDISVPPDEVRKVSLTEAVRTAIKEDAIGIEVTSSLPVTATMRSVIADDVSFPAPVQPAETPMSLLVPPGKATVVLADAQAVGVATVKAWTAEGDMLEPQRGGADPGCRRHRRPPGTRRTRPGEPQADLGLRVAPGHRAPRGHGHGVPRAGPRQAGPRREARIVLSRLSRRRCTADRPARRRCRGARRPARQRR